MMLETFLRESSLLHIVTSDTSLIHSNLPAMNFVPIKTRVLSTSPSRLSPPSHGLQETRGRADISYNPQSGARLCDCVGQLGSMSHRAVSGDHLTD